MTDHSPHSPGKAPGPSAPGTPFDAEIDVKRILEIGAWLAAITVAAGIVGFFIYKGLGGWSERTDPKPSPLAEAAIATVEAADGSLYRTRGGDTDLLRAGARVESGEGLRSDGGAVLELSDSSRIEMRSKAEMSLESANDGVRIRPDLLVMLDRSAAAQLGSR